MFKKRKNSTALTNLRVHKEGYARITDEGKVEEEDEESLSSLETLQRLKQEQASRRKTNGIPISLESLDFSQREIHSKGGKGRNIDAKEDKFERKQLETHSSQLTHEALKEAYVAEKLGMLHKTTNEYCL